MQSAGYLGVSASFVSVRGARLWRLLSAKLRGCRALLEHQQEPAERQNGAEEEFQGLFRRFVSAAVGRKCLGVLFEQDALDVPGEGWSMVDLATVERKVRENGVTVIDAPDDCFDTVLCAGLEKVERPQDLIKEIRRVLKKEGEFWVQAPLNAPYVPSGGLNPVVYWRFTPEGMRSLLSGFDEILCSVYEPSNLENRSFTFFYGLKSGDSESSELDKEPALCGA